MPTRTSTLVMTLATSLILSACGGNDAAETPDDVVTPDVSRMMEQQLERAEDVKIKDKKSLNKNQRIANTYINSMDDLATAMSKIDDEASAQEAVKVMRDVGKKLDEMAQEFEGAGANRERAIAMAMMSRQQEMMAVQQRMAAQMMRIQREHPELMAVLSEGMQEMTP